MVRVILELVLIVIIARTFWRVIGAVMEGLQGGPSSRAPDRRGVLVRDPVCGTYILQERAVVVMRGGQPVFFCSDACRDQYFRGRSA
jgi:YHS domain-containing protein